MNITIKINKLEGNSPAGDLVVLEDMSLTIEDASLTELTGLLHEIRSTRKALCSRDACACSVKESEVQVSLQSHTSDSKKRKSDSETESLDNVDVFID